MAFLTHSIADTTHSIKAGSIVNGAATYNFDSTAGTYTISGSGLAPAGSTGQIQYKGASGLAANANLFWDITNARLGVGTSTPGSGLQITNSADRVGAIISANSTQTNNLLSVRNSNGTALYTLQGSGTETASTDLTTKNYADGKVGGNTITTATLVDGQGLFWDGTNSKFTNRNSSKLWGSCTWVGTANCLWSSGSSTSTTPTAFGADTDCPTPTVTGAASAPGTKIPACVFSTIPAGTYEFIMRGLIRNESNTIAGIWLNDGSTNFYVGGFGSNADEKLPMIRYKFATAGYGSSTTLQPYWSSFSGSIIFDLQANVTNMDFVIELWQD